MNRSELIEQLRLALAGLEGPATAVEFKIGPHEYHLEDLEPWLEIHSYKNTTSEAGTPDPHRILASEVSHARVWTDSMANPNYVLHMHNGDTHYLPGQYGVMNKLHRVPETIVRRRKELF